MLLGAGIEDVEYVRRRMSVGLTQNVALLISIDDPHPPPHVPRGRSSAASASLCKLHVRIPLSTSPNKSLSSHLRIRDY